MTLATRQAALQDASHHLAARQGIHKAAVKLLFCFLQVLNRFLVSWHSRYSRAKAILPTHQPGQATGPAEEQDVNLSAPKMHGTIENVESTLVTVVVMSPGPEDASA